MAGESSHSGKFVKVYADLANDKGLEAREWRTYWNIFSFQRDRGELVTRLAFPSQKRLAQMDGVSVVTIKRAVRRLVERGHVIVGTCRLPNGGVMNVYWQAFRGDPLAQGWDHVVIPGVGSHAGTKRGITWWARKKTEQEVDGAVGRWIRVRAEHGPLLSAARQQRGRFVDDLGFDLAATLRSTLKVLP